MNEESDEVLGTLEADVIEVVVSNLERFSRFAVRDELIFPGLTRRDFYTPEETARVRDAAKRAGVTADTRKGIGPAKTAFLIAGGSVPQRRNGKAWSVHHVYERFKSDPTSLAAVLDGNHFTRTGGLVAVHPILDALASEYLEVAKRLQRECELRFGYTGPVKVADAA